VFYYYIIVSCFHLSLASWLLFSNKVQFSSVLGVHGSPVPLSRPRGCRVEMAAVLFTAYTYTVGWSSGVSLARLSVKTRRTMAQPLGTYWNGRWRVTICFTGCSASDSQHDALWQRDSLEWITLLVKSISHRLQLCRIPGRTRICYPSRPDPPV